MTAALALSPLFLLYFSLRRRNPSIRISFGVFLTMLALAVLLLWPPVWHWLEGA